MTTAWKVVDESVPDQRPPILVSLSIRDTTSGRLVADMPAEPIDYPGAVARTRREAELIAMAPRLLELARKAVRMWGVDPELSRELAEMEAVLDILPAS